ncbi:MAG: hypothetical protein AB1491_07040 [Thermodesulfobacteriota bacterium]
MMSSQHFRTVAVQLASGLLCLYLLSGSFCCPPISLARVPGDNEVTNFYEIFLTKAISNIPILPNVSPLYGSPLQELTVIACPGEYEPVTFTVRAHQGLSGLLVTPSDLQNGKFTIPASALDIKVVKCWFQSGRKINETKQCVLVPELLLKDDKLVRVDLENKKNYLRTKDPSGEEHYVCISGPTSEHLQDILPRDADTLQPVDLPQGTNKQFWITVNVPADAHPGLYEGKIRLAAVNVPTIQLRFKLRVLPFALEKPGLKYSIYYRGKLTEDGKGTIGSEFKSPQQYLAEMLNLKAHGVEDPTIYQESEALLCKELELRARAGISQDALYSLGVRTGNPQIEEALATLRYKVKKWLEIAGQYGYAMLYVYGIDEARGEIVKSQRPAWEAVRQTGGKVFVAIRKGFFGVVGDLLDLAIFGGPPDPQEAKNYHQVGNQIFCYSNPQVGVEEPETYRRNFGLLLWKSEYDGAMNYAYQHSFGHIWNDFDSEKERYRDHVFAYPTIDGVIDTIQWEGFREGIDDVRYLATLLKTILQTRVTKPKLAAQAQNLVDNIDPQGDLDVLRAEMIEWILQLQ